MEILRRKDVSVNLYYDEYMAAYRLWCQLLEEPRFVRHFDWPEGSVFVCNNWRCLHGRASVPPGVERTMVWGYTTKTITENRYRLLKALRAERDSTVTTEELLDTTWLTRLPNQVLKHMVV